MSDDVLITPASRKIEFFDSGGNIDGKIELDASGNLNITSAGSIGIGDITQDIHVGDGTQAVDLVFDFASSIYSVANQDLTIGKKSLGGNEVIIDTPTNLTVNTDSGNIDIGPRNTSFCHIRTDRSKFYFNKPLVIDGGDTNGDAYLISSYNTEDFVIATNNGTEDRITVKQATGNVGINQTSPQYMLDVAGSVFIGNSNETTALTGSASLEMKGDSALMTFKADNASSGDQIAGIRVFADSYRSAGMVIGDYSNTDGATTEDWLIGRGYASTNKVGISATPENGGDEYVTAVNESQKKVIIAADNDDIDFQIKGTSNTYFHADAANERVGIGTTSPSQTLHVQSATAGVLIESTATSGEAPVLDLYKNDTGPAVSEAIGTIKFSGENDTDQKVTYAEIQAFIEDETDATENAALQFFVQEMGTPRENLRLASNQITFNNNERNVDVLIKSDDGSTNFFSDAGNNRVGIGTTSPGHVLHVLSEATEIIAEDGSSGIKTGIKSGDAAGNVGTFTNSNFNILTNSNTRMRITSGGDVGIGTTSPGYKLDVNGSIRAVDDIYTDKLIASEGIRSSNRASFNTMQMYYYDRQSMGTQAVLLRVPVGGSSTANPSVYYMPHAGVVMQVMMGFYSQTLATSGTDTWSIIKTDTNGTAQSVDFDINFANLNRVGTTNSYNILIDVSVLADASNVDFVAGDMLQIQRTDSSPISIGNCNAQLWVTFDI